MSMLRRFMQHTATNESQLFKNFQANDEQFLSERLVIRDIRRELVSKKRRGTNKDIILALLLRLESERNTEIQDVYRNALEIVVSSTPDDFDI